MSTCTPGGLVYPTGSDDPCAISDVMCQFVTRVEERLDAVDAIINRTATSRPLLKLQSTVPATYGDPAVLEATVFDTALVDTDGMFTSAVPNLATVNTSGIYELTADAWGTVTGPGTDVASASLRFQQVVGGGSGAGATIFQEARSFLATAQNFYISGSCSQLLAAGDTIQMVAGFFATTPGTITAMRIQFNVMWLGDA